MYNQLMALTNLDAFYFKDSVVNGNTYRVFMYRLAGYTEFCLPGALEARGITYLLLPDQDPICVCRPFKKFFNLGETPFTMNLDLTQIARIAEKADGSLISTVWDPVTNYFGVKSKQSFESEQAVEAWKYLNLEENKGLLADTKLFVSRGYTVNFEYTSPLNRIVLEYKTTQLKVLGIRNNVTGELYNIHDEFFDGNSKVNSICSHWVEEHTLETFPHALEDIPNLTGIEGYVVTMKDGLMYKHKTEWYKSLHHLKDSVSSERRLFDAIIEETIDDVKTMFPTDTVSLDRIKAMEDFVIPKYNHLVKTVEAFYKDNKDLTRKDYAIKGQLELGMLFNLAMMLFLGKDPKFKDFAKKFRKEYFDIKDEVLSTD